MVKIPKELLKKLVSYLQTVSNNHIHGESDQNGVDSFYCADCLEDFGDKGSGRHKNGCLQSAAQQLLSEIEVCTPNDESD
jgi:hypothetical protein